MSQLVGFNNNVIIILFLLDLELCKSFFFLQLSQFISCFQSPKYKLSVLTRISNHCPFCNLAMSTSSLLGHLTYFQSEQDSYVNKAHMSAPGCPTPLTFCYGTFQPYITLTICFLTF